MKRIFSLILVCLLAVPSSMMAAQAAAPAQNAPISAWHSWFTSLRRPTRQDALRAKQFVKSKWQCMVRGRNCSATERNSLRMLAAAAAAAIVKGLHSGYKNRQKKRQDEQAARRQAQQAQRQQHKQERQLLAEPLVRDRQEVIGEMIQELKESRRTGVQPQDIWGDDVANPRTVHRWGTPQGVAEGAILVGDIDLLQRLINEKAVNLKEDNVDLSRVFDYSRSREFIELISKAPGVDAAYLSQVFGKGVDRKTLLSRAIGTRPNPDLIQLLLEAGANPTITSSPRRGEALFDAVAAFGYARNREEHDKVLETIRLLVRYGSNPDAIIMAGRVQKSVREMAREAMDMKPGDDFPYLKGQADADEAMEEIEEILKGRSEIKSANKQE